jgi:hypothetical protein
VILWLACASPEAGPATDRVGIFGDSPIENLVLDPGYDRGRFPFSNSNGVDAGGDADFQVMYLADTPTRQAAMRVGPARRDPGARTLWIQARVLPRPLAVSVWIGHDDGTTASPAVSFLWTDAASGNDMKMPLVAGESRGGEIAWSRYAASVPGAEGWGGILVEIPAEELGSTWVTGPVVVEDNARARPTPGVPAVLSAQLRAILANDRDPVVPDADAPR